MKNKFVFYGALILGVCLEFSLFAQTGDANITESTAVNALAGNSNQNIMLARSNDDYRVTQGDVYTLNYNATSGSVSYTITVDSSYRIRVSNLGVINGAGKTFTQLKSEVETIVTNNYPLSGAQLVLTQSSLFKVFVTGEVNSTMEVSVWALIRLSALADALTGENLTSHASIRDVSIRSSNGQTRTYDLFRVKRFGDMSQDPYLRPGDTVTFSRIERVVSINGEVERPGTYQMLQGENLKELIEVYANGFTHLAYTAGIELVRLVNTDVITGGKIILTEHDMVYNYVLENFDSIYIPTIIQLRPVMFVEGAVERSASGAAPATTNRLLVQFTQGETYAALVRRNNIWFTMVSDTQNAYIIRNNDRIPINLNPILYDTTYQDNVMVLENDVLVIPFRQYFVSVSGAVRSPGRFPYIPDRDWEYYIGLAGGFIEERNTGKSVTITDMDGRLMKKTDAISPETLITANANHPLYFFNMYAPVISTVFSLISSSLALWAIIRR